MVPVAFIVITMGVVTWYVPPAGVVEFAAEVLAKSRQVRLPVWHLVHVRRVEQHLGVGGAARTLDLLQETSTFCVVGGENLGTTRNKEGVIKMAGCKVLPLVSPRAVRALCSFAPTGRRVM